MNLTLLRNRSQPPGGWSYWCPVGEMDFPGGFAFDVQVDKIRSYRAANPSLNLPSDLGSCRSELLQFTFARLRKQYGAEETLRWFSVEDSDDAEITELLKKNTMSLSSDQPNEEAVKPVEGVIETVARIAQGSTVLADWLGSRANPVSPTLAFQRAGTCVPCKKNQEGNWVARLAGAVGGFIREQVALKKEMNLATPDDDKLTTCQVCQCHLPLLVWVPIETLAERTDAATLSKYPKHCWKAREIHTLNYGTPTPSKPPRKPKTIK